MNEQERARLLNIFRRGAWFGALESDLQRLLVERLAPRSFAKGETISREEGPSRGLCALLRGRVGFVRSTEGGDECLVHVAEPVFWFGELGLLTRRTAVTTLALTPVRALALSPAAFEEIVAAEPRYYRPFAELALERFAAAYRFVAENHLLPAETRLRTRLADLAELRAQDAPQAGPITLGLSQEELARVVGLSRQTVNPLLRGLQVEGLIELESRKIRVLDPARLRTCRGAGDRRLEAARGR